MENIAKWSVGKHVYIFIAAAVCLAAAAGLRPGDDSAAAAGYPGPVIRFHVIANSDSLYDQALKLKVRDAVIGDMAPVLAGAGDIGEARARVDANLELIRAAANRVLRENGCGDPVAVMRGNYHFPRKTYRIKKGDEGETADLTLPAGEYEAVRVIIGSGMGANWWCVLFPPLCFVSPAQEHAAEKNAKNEVPAAMPAFGHDPAAPGFMPDPPAVECRFKVVEWYRQVRDWGLGIGD